MACYFFLFLSCYLFVYLLLEVLFHLLGCICDGCSCFLPPADVLPYLFKSNNTINATKKNLKNERERIHLIDKQSLRCSPHLDDPLKGGGKLL